MAWRSRRARHTTHPRLTDSSASGHSRSGVGGSGGGRTKTKEWLANNENRHYLEKLEKKIEAVLLNLDGESLRKFCDDWQVFMNKAVNRSKKQREWQSSDGRHLPDYPVGCKEPKVLMKVKER